MAASTSSFNASKAASEESKQPAYGTIVPHDRSYTIANIKRQQFVTTLKQEIKQELIYAHEADQKRAPVREPFITQITTQINKLLAIIPTDVISATAIKIATGLVTIAGLAAEKIRDDRLAMVANSVEELDLIRLDILLDNVAREALWSYEQFIVDRLVDELKDGVTPFARIGAHRILEYISRQNKAEIKKNNGLLITESTLLTGLIKGRSGRGIEGFKNTQLKLKSHGELSLKTISAECVYGRPGFQVFELKAGKIVDKLYTRASEMKEQAKRIIGKTSTYSKLRKKDKGFEHDPKAGFILMREPKITEYKYVLHAIKEYKKGRPPEYNYVQQVIIKDKKEHKLEITKFSDHLLTELNTTSSHSIMAIDLETLKSFIAWSNLNSQKSILAYMHQEYRLPWVQQVTCKALDLRNCDLEKANLSYMDLSGSKLGGKNKTLNQINFTESYLVNVFIEPGTCLHKAIFHNAHCEGLTAEEVIFNDCTLTQTTFAFAGLKKATFKQCRTLGTIWIRADLAEINDETITEEQRKQTLQLEKEMAEQKKKTEQLQREMIEQRDILNRLSLDIVNMKQPVYAPVQPIQLETKELERLTPELTRTLKIYYAKFRDVPKLFSDRTQPISDINVTIVDPSKKTTPVTDQKETKEEKSAEEKTLDYYEKEYQVQTSIPLQDIFNSHAEEKESNDPTKLLITGKPGSGKTTLSLCIPFLWSIDTTKESKSEDSKALWQDRFDFVFRISLRNLNRYKENLNLAEIIYGECCFSKTHGKEEKEKLIALIAYVLKTKKNRCLLILDGADEAAQWINENPTNKIKEILEEMLSQHNVLVTSRPYQVRQLESLLPESTGKKFNIELENIGFTDNQIETYILQYFETDEQARNLIKFLKANPRIWGTAHVPIQLALICWAWEQHEKDKKSFPEQMSTTNLYQQICSDLQKRFLQSKKNKSLYGYTKQSLFQDKACYNEIHFLQQLAFLTLQNGDVEFDSQKIEIASQRTYKACRLNNPTILKSALEMDYLVAAGEEDQNGIHKRHHFIHLTFQEFLAARYIKECLELDPKSERFKDAIEFIKKNRYISRFQALMGFISGLVSDKSSKVALQHFWNAVLSEPLDVTGIGHFRLIITCLEEANCDADIPYCTELLDSINNLFIRKEVVAPKIITHIAEPRINILPLLKNCPIVCEKTVINLCIADQDSFVASSIATAEILMQLATTWNEKVIEKLLDFITKNRFQKWPILKAIVKTLCELDEAYEAVIFYSLIEDIADHTYETLTNLTRFTDFSHQLKLKDNLEIVKDLATSPEIYSHWDFNTQYIITEICKNGPIHDVFAALLTALQKGSDTQIIAATNILENLFQKIKNDDIIKIIRDNMTHVNLEIRMASMKLLGKISKTELGKNVIDALLQILESDFDSKVADEKEQYCFDKTYVTKIKLLAVRTLGDIGKNAATPLIVKTLFTFLNQEDKKLSLKREIAIVLVKFSAISRDKTIISKLLDALQHSHTLTKIAIAEALKMLDRKMANQPEIINTILSVLKRNSYVLFPLLAALENLAFDVVDETLINKIIITLLRIPNAHFQNIQGIFYNLGAKAAIPQVIDASLKVRGKWESESEINLPLLIKFSQFNPEYVLSSALKNLDWLWDNLQNKKIKSLLLECNFPLQLLIKMYFKTEDKFLPKLIAINAARQNVPLSFDKNGITIYDGVQPQLLSPPNLKQWKTLAKKLAREFKKLWGLHNIAAQSYLAKKPAFPPTEVAELSSVREDLYPHLTLESEAKSPSPIMMSR